VATEGGELRALLTKQNHAGETMLYVAAECGYALFSDSLIFFFSLSCKQLLQ